MQTEDQELAQKQHNQTDEELQLQQNSLIERNTKITILLGILAIVVQILDTIINLLK